MKCDFCGRDEALPFVCNYCGGAFCADHRLPEAHQCKGDLTQRRTITAPQTTTFTWQTPAYTSAPQPARQAKVFSTIELRDIVIAWLALGIAFSFALSGGAFSFFSGSEPLSYAGLLVGVALVTVGPGFVFHELSHKFVARKYGFWAEFRMWPMGLALALFSSLIGFVFAAPGATYISGANISKTENGKISLAGPLTNVAIAALFLPFFFFGSGVLYAVGYIGVQVNIFLAMFNMLPIGPLDGAKVWRWNLFLWGVVFVPLALVLAFFFGLI